MSENIFKDIKIPQTWRLELSGLIKGIDNYHVDVRLSKQFCSDVKILIAELIRRETDQKQFKGDAEKAFSPLCKSYLDMMTVLIHRVKTDLSVEQVCFLQFSIPKFILDSVTTALNMSITETKKQATDLRNQGSMQVLKVQHQLTWMSKHYNSIVYHVKKEIFEHLYRTEHRQLTSIREQYLGSSVIDFQEFLSNVLMLNRDLNSSQFLIEHYISWGGDLEESEFPKVNLALEELMQKELPELDTQTLRVDADSVKEPLEVYDDLRGLRAIQYYLGPAINMREKVEEAFCWFDSPASLKTLFDIDTLRENIPGIKEEYGSKAARDYKKQIKTLEKFLKRFGALLGKLKYLKHFIASYEARKIWASVFNEELDPKLLCQYLGGECSVKRLQDPALGGRQISDEEEVVLKNSLKQISQAINKNLNDSLINVLVDISRFRLHLKYTRFAHRIFNRMSILTEENDIELSKQARTLFQLHCANEIEEDEAKIVHHTIMKADVRGSTVVTEMLEKKNLNPASYFSLHFFNPINEIIPRYGGGKVFIEGDAVILSLLEYQHTPQQWFSVARACGLARSMLRIIHANNKFAKQSELPSLELGIGICFSADAPRFLFDGEQPIMISSAIGLADRLSSCSWKLRAKMQSKIFSVEVLAYADDERDKGEKGQQMIRYNVNGILLENAAFSKLEKEVKLRKISASFDKHQEHLYYGIYKDAEGGRHDIVIREGRVGVWKDETIIRGEENAEPYYEVVTNGKVISMLRDKLKT
ncbi:hypothetical protein JYT97_00495 [Haliea sp. AH-315-K21]|uniref:Guanylate cyclase domain-containing protein n=1 Tax=SAR86 cluster bacterium TaxID=2030880 RepID=A0A2A5CE67_9GAMM|nr:hypothetical protein [Haliea sp. AH-315-K21]MBN4075676.1 hypothetical protein [Gammaproteobacteria bacterium AH-315-E17]PCJ42177.1 MAG: hypothetical protein COA71_06195 [SAR86 cluster bacterium]